MYWPPWLGAMLPIKKHIPIEIKLFDYNYDDNYWVTSIVVINSVKATVETTGPELHWRRDKMAEIFQTTFSNVFSWMKM